MAISQEILDGREAVELARTNHASLYTQNLSGEALAHGHEIVMDELNDDLVAIGFENSDDFFSQSQQADIDNEIPFEERWE